MKFYENITKGIRVMDRTRNQFAKKQREITRKVKRQELSFLRATHLWVMVYACVKFYEHITKGIRDMLRTRKCLRRTRRDDVRSIVSPDFRPGVVITIDWYMLKYGNQNIFP